MKHKNALRLPLSPFYPGPDLTLPVTHKAPVVCAECVVQCERAIEREAFLKSCIKQDFYVNLLLQLQTCLVYLTGAMHSTAIEPELAV